MGRLSLSNGLLKPSLTSQERRKKLPLLLDSLDTQALTDIACLFLNQGKHQQSAWFSEEVLLRDPTCHDALSNLGACYVALGRDDDARHSLNAAIRVNAAHPGGWFNMAALCRKELRIEDERACLEIAMAQDAPNLQDVIWCALAHNSQYSGEDSRAIDEYLKALEFNPSNQKARMSAGILQMKLGRWDEGLRNYEARLGPHPVRWASDTIPKWTNEFLYGKSILVCAEQGTGDLFQYARYIRELKNLFPMPTRVGLFCPDSMVSIMSKWPGCDEIYSPASGALPVFDFQLAMMSIPALLRRFDREFLIPPVSPRITARERCHVDKYVGLCWRGNPNHPNDEFRSIGVKPLKDLLKAFLYSYAPIFYSFQADPTQEEIGILPIVFSGCGLSWEGTATELLGLDLLITCDTAVAHMAGSLGVPTWILLPLNSDFRWGVGSSTTPLYPSVRLFRQEKLGDWGPVIAEVVKELEKL